MAKTFDKIVKSFKSTLADLRDYEQEMRQGVVSAEQSIERAEAHKTFCEGEANRAGTVAARIEALIG